MTPNDSNREIDLITLALDWKTIYDKGKIQFLDLYTLRLFAFNKKEIFMNFAIRIVLFFSILLSPLSSEALNPICKWPGEKIPHCDEIPSDLPAWGPGSRGYIVRTSNILKLDLRLDPIRYRLTPAQSRWTIEKLELTYYVRTEDGTAKAGRDYGAVTGDHPRKWTSYPGKVGRDSSGNLYNASFPNNQNVNIGIRTKTFKYCNNPGYDEAAKYDGKLKYFYVVLERPYLRMDLGDGPATGAAWGYVYDGAKPWDDGDFIERGHNTPREIRYIVFIEQGNTVQKNCN